MKEKQMGQSVQPSTEIRGLPATDTADLTQLGMRLMRLGEDARGRHPKPLSRALILAGTTEQAVRQQLTLWRDANRPATEEQIIELLQMMEAVLRSRSVAPTAQSLRYQVFFELFQDVPARVLASAVRAYMQTEIWFPEPSPLLERCESGMQDVRTQRLVCEQAERLLGEPARPSLVAPVADDETKPRDIKGLLDKLARNMRAK